MRQKKQNAQKEQLFFTIALLLGLIIKVSQIYK